jgi:hypothetical protein
MSMTFIESVTVGAGGQASITFNSIPQTFTDLMFLFSTREGTSNTGSYIVASFNSTTTGYSFRELGGIGSGSGFTNGYTTGTAARIVTYSQAGATTANTFASAKLYIPNYRTATNKNYSSEAVMEDTGSVSTQLLGAGVWANSAAITSASFTAFFGTNWAQGSTAALYGITAGSSGGVVIS